MQVGQGLAIVEPGDLRHHPFEQTEKAFGFRNEALQPFAPVHAFDLAVLIQQLGGAGR